MGRKKRTGSHRTATRRNAAQRDAVLAYDVGGTKIHAGIVTSEGHVIEEIRVPAPVREGKDALVQAMAMIGRSLLKGHPSVRRAGVASAGPLHPGQGVLLSPTNMKTKSKHWGVVPLVARLEKGLGIPVTLENDAAAAILAETWVGAGRGTGNAMILTLGTGLGTGVVCNGALVRAGRGLHTEAGHVIVNHLDRSARCGCGNVGCAEAYLSGNAFARRASARLKRKLKAEEIAELAREGNRAARAAFDEYAELMAVAIHNYVVLYAPELVVLTGSFAACADLFLARTRRRLERLLASRRRGIDMLPEIRVSSLGNRAGLIGAAYVATHSRGKQR